MENFDLQPKENALNSEALKKSSLTRGSVFIVLVLSLLFGGVGGSAATIFLYNSGKIQKYSEAINTISGPSSVTVNEDSATIDVVKKASPAVVSIVVSKDLSKLNTYSPFDDQFFFPFFGFGRSQNNQTQPNVQQVGAGTGFFVSSDGTILTNKHVVSDASASYSVITSDGKTYDAKILATDPVNDLAILKVELNNAPYLEMSDSGQIQIGQKVIAIGNSLGQYQNTVTSGIVSGIGRSITAGGRDGSELLEGVIQTDAAINPGNSGGPLLNVVGQVIGINTAVDREGQLVGFAIPSNDAKKSLESFRQNGRIAKPFLGVRYLNITKTLAESEDLPKDFGALLIRGETRMDFAVLPGSPADKAGLMENDIILEIGGKQINEQMSLARALRDYKVGDEVELKIYSKGSEKMVKVKLEEAK